MANTHKDVVYRAMAIVSLRAADEEPSADDFEFAMKDFLALREFLGNEMKIRWADNDIADSRFADIAGMLAGRLVLSFPVGDKARMRGLEAESIGERNLKRVRASRSRRNVAVPVV